MCGIAGIFNRTSSKKIEPIHLKKLISSIIHRGPDEFGAYLDNSIGLAHARLSIIDINNGIQPIHNEDKSIWVIFNGEIYNYLELKENLVKKGHKFYTSTDTEVLIHLYEEKGEEFLNDLNGQFAFAIWDSKRDELFLARDRLGIRPLHYTISEGQFIFASEIKSIFSFDSVNRNIDPSSLMQIFTYWSTLPGFTIFENIKELPPGYFLKITKEKIISERYWDLPYYNEEIKYSWSLDRMTEKIVELLYDSIKLRLRADVPVGAYLSGGLDSSIITTIVKEKFNNELHSFGIRFKDERFDEGEYQAKLVNQIRTNHSEISVSNIDISNYFPDVIWHTEKPILRTAPIPLYMLSNLVYKNNLKVVLTGEGADEFFGGYNIFREAKVRWFWSRNKNSTLRPKLLSKLYPYIFNDNRLQNSTQSFFGQGLDEWNNPFFSHQIRWNNTSKILRLLHSDIVLKRANSNSQPGNLLPDNFEKRDYFEKAQYLEVSTFLSNYLLSSQGDRVAMANSIEIRFPFLDHRLIDFMAKVPSRFKIYGMTEKFLLKRAFRKKLPNSIVNRPKQPYRAPISKSLLINSNSDELKYYISKNAVKDAGIFDSSKVEKLTSIINKKNNSAEWEDMAISGIISTQAIYEMFVKNFKPGLGESIIFDLFIDNRKRN